MRCANLVPRAIMPGRAGKLALRDGVYPIAKAFSQLRILLYLVIRVHIIDLLERSFNWLIQYALGIEKRAISLEFKAAILVRRVLLYIG